MLSSTTRKQRQKQECVRKKKVQGERISVVTRNKVVWRDRKEEDERRCRSAEAQCPAEWCAKSRDHVRGDS